MKIVNCINCDKEYKIKNYRISVSKFCSKECQFIHKNTFYKDLLIKKGDSLLCYKCLEYKPESSFYDRENNSCKTRNGKSQKCSDCTNKANEYWRNIEKSTVEGTLRIALIRAKNSCKKRKLEFDLTYDFLLDLLKKQEYKCAITKLELTNTNNYEYKTISIDRINSNFGYTKNNVHLVCWVVNQMKNDMSFGDFINWCNIIVKNNIK
jgi:hypothetical protein